MKQMPRIIGAICIIIAITAYVLNKSGAIPMAITGLLLIIAPIKHTQENLKLVIQTIKRWKTILTTALYDAINWALIFLTLVLFTKWETKIIQKAQSAATLTKDAMLDPALTAKNVEAVQGVIVSTIIAGLALLLICLAIYTLSRGLIWTKISKQKFTKKYFKKLLGLNAAWWAIWLPIYILLGMAAAKTSIKEPITIVFLIGFYFTPILHTLFTKKQQIGHSLGHGIAYGITKIHKLIIPYAYALLAYIIIYQPFRLVQNTKIQQAATILLVVLYLAWLRTYLYEIIKKFE